MHFSIIPPGPNMSAMLGEGVSAAEVLTEGVMRPSEVSGCNLNTMLPRTPERDKGREEGPLPLMFGWKEKARKNRRAASLKTACRSKTPYCSATTITPALWSI
jgi:hypothetical protein